MEYLIDRFGLNYNEAIVVIHSGEGGGRDRIMYESSRNINQQNSFGKGVYKTKITIIDENTGEVDEFIYSSSKSQYLEVRKQIRDLFADEQQENDEYKPFAERYLLFILADPQPDKEEEKKYFRYLQKWFCKKVTGLAERQQDPREWDKARTRFNRAFPKYLDYISDVGSFTFKFDKFDLMKINDYREE